jgi:uncharacterized protein YggU (UPF0235/DUF167 family)
MRVAVRVSPDANRTEVGGRYGDAEPPILLVRVSAPAVDGKANAATITAVADSLNLPRRNLRIVSGQRSRTKILEVEGADPGALAALLGRLTSRSTSPS